MLVDELSSKYEVPKHLSELASKQNKGIVACLDWLYNNHGVELIGGELISPITDCPHATSSMNWDLVRSEEFMKTISEGGLNTKDDDIVSLEKPMYACLQCGICQEGKPYTHYYESGHYLAVNLFDLSVWCSECKAYFKDPSLETLGGKYKHFKGWSECFQVEYEKGTAPDGSQYWQVVSIREPSTAIEHFTLWNYMRMGESMARSNLLCTVDLSDCNISLEALTVLFGRIITWPLLEYLNLSGIMLEEEGMKILEPFLSARSSLATLNLDRNSLELEGVELLSDALNHVRVENLYLDDNGICDEGLEKILISENAQYLNELWLCSNDIDNEGYGAVILR